ncbi:hypothetical protein G3O00_26765 [Burkholderia sp. Ac-20384]|uniref:hypothetical protein n=1 Tax=Burkholderia sp. Ac-20384 TaxID=2703902 RepID=UPI0019826D35|nr:hypothetical protein [Burkholderia sp. Ac-20384]MBN3827205.1 hypothetical protein [Burkholderia sp. Ac-20384]
MSNRRAPSSRRHQPSAHAKLARTLLLPMPRQKAEELALQYHSAFQALRMGRGSAHGLAVLLQLVVLAGFVDEARKHELRVEVLVATERGINAALEQGKTCGEWVLDPQTDELVAALIGWHDDQLRAAPLAVFAEALERLERMRDGRSYDRPPARRVGTGSRLG